MSLFSSLVRPLDDHLTEDARAVSEAARRLRIGEFDLYRLAYRRWFQREPETKALESLFAAYLFRQETVPWVRAFCRDVLARARQGALVPEDFDAHRVRRREPPPAARPDLPLLALGLILLAYLFVKALS